MAVKAGEVFSIMKVIHDMSNSIKQQEQEIRLFLGKSISSNIEIGNDENIFERGLVTSNFALQLVLFLESQFNIVVETEDLELSNFASIAAMCNFLVRKTEASAA